MGMGVPILNEYKRSFLFKRIPQTVLGGLKVKLGYRAPTYVYVNQVALWLFPFLLGCLFTLVLELAYTDDQISNFLLMYSCLYGACITIFVVIVQTITIVMEIKEKEVQYGGKAIRKKNSLADEDEIEFKSCCGAETIAFVIPPKKFKINIAVHSLISGAVCGLGYWYLLPYSLNNLYYHNYGATAVIFILGWLTVCIAQYSLTTTAPPEPAIYRTMDAYEILPLTRPLYTIICYSIHIANWYNSDFRVANQTLHVVFVMLPLMWFSGLLPPAEVLLLWMLEQGHVFLLGGSPAASIARLLVNVILSTGVFLGCYFLSSCFGAVVLAALTGYLLSCDLGTLGTQVWSAFHKSSKNRISAAKPTMLVSLSAPHSTMSGFLWSWCLPTVCYHIVMTAVATTAAAVTNYYASRISLAVSDYLGYCIIAVCVTEKLLRDFQSVFIFFGFWRNILYPLNTGNSVHFRKRKRRLLFLGFLRRTLNNWVSPLLMIVYLSLKVVTSDGMSVSCVSGISTARSIFVVFAIVRAYRWVWQSTTHALLEMAVVHIILITVPENSIFLQLEIPVLQLIVGVLRDRFFQLVNKLYFFLTLMVASWTDNKQSRNTKAGITVLDIIFFPVVFTMIAVACVLSAPLLCLFTLPLFYIGYPRPTKFWPEPVGASSNTCLDTLYYKQLSFELVTTLRSAFANGSMGEPHVGNHYLMRFQDRLVWIMILERGAGFCTINIKGLELQETSCHAAEASRIDDQFGEAFEGKDDSCNAFSLNNFPLHCLTPLDAAEIKTYSDARNVLTGVIDSPDSVGITLSFFVRSLIWVLLHHINKLKIQEEEAKKIKEKEIALMRDIESTKDRDGSGGGNKRRDKISVVNNNMTHKELDHIVSSPSKRQDSHISTSVRKHDISNPHVGSGDRCVKTPSTGTRTNVRDSPSTGTRTNVRDSHPGSRESTTSQKVSLSSSLHSFTDSIWSDEFDMDKVKRKPTSVQPKRKVSTVVSITNNSPNRQPSHSVFAALPSVNINKKSYGAFNDTKNATGTDSFLNDLEFGLPAVDVNVPLTHPYVNFGSTSQAADSVEVGKSSSHSTKPKSKFTVTNGNHIYKPVINLAGSPDFKCPYSSHISVPVKWRELPIEPSQLLHYMSQFPASWYKHTLGTLNWSSTCQPRDKVATDVAADDALTNCYSQLVMACYSAFDTPGRPGGANYLFKCYNEDVPWNAMMDWLSEDKDLYKLVIRAFRYGFKLMLDQTLLGDISSHEELEATLQSYDKDWYIGKETDVDWGLAVKENRRNLFSVGQNMAQGTYTSRSLSLQGVMVHMGRINRESVIGQWSNLNLELLYMTNDDEERYSIQAQPAMLRNLTVQAADPPLGYPIYSSPPISVPTI